MGCTIFPGTPPQSMKLDNLAVQIPNIVKHGLSQKMLSSSIWILGGKVVVKQNLSIGTIFGSKIYLDVSEYL